MAWEIQIILFLFMQNSVVDARDQDWRGFDGIATGKAHVMMGN